MNKKEAPEAKGESVEDIARAVIGYLWPDDVSDEPTPDGIREVVHRFLLARKPAEEHKR